MHQADQRLGPGDPQGQGCLPGTPVALDKRRVGHGGDHREGDQHLPHHHRLLGKEQLPVAKRAGPRQQHVEQEANHHGRHRLQGIDAGEPEPAAGQRQIGQRKAQQQGGQQHQQQSDAGDGEGDPHHLPQFSVTTEQQGEGSQRSVEQGRHQAPPSANRGRASKVIAGVRVAIISRWHPLQTAPDPPP